MDPWVILDIPRTSDKALIKRAYMAQLVKHNPEDDPEGFQRVRGAYEQIVREMETGEDESPMGVFMKKVEALYADFSQRVSVPMWKELLEDEICTQLATEDEAGMRILEFLMGNWYLPGAVLEVLDSRFGWMSRKQELKREFPVNFLTFVENQIEVDYPNYSLFETDINPDRFIFLFHEAESQINRNNLDGAEALIKEMEETGVKHPCLMQIKSRLALFQGDVDRAHTYAKAVYTQHPDDIDTRYIFAQALFAVGSIEEAQGLYEEIVKELPSHFGAERGIIECLVTKGDFEEAREMLLTAHDKHPSSAYIFTAIHHVSEMLIEKYLALHQEDPDDIETTFMLAKHYLNRQRFDECFELLSKHASPGCHIRYYEFMGECYLRKGENEIAVDYLLKDVSNQPKYLNYLKLALVYYELGCYEDAIIFANDGLALDDDDSVSEASLHNAKGMAYYKQGKNELALASFDEAISVNDRLYFLYTGKANVYKDMQMYAEAIDCCAESVALLPYNPDPYAIEMEIYLLTDQSQRIPELIEQTEQFQISEFPRIKYYKACALDMQKRYNEAMEILTELIIDEEMDDEEYRPRIYREMAYICERMDQPNQAISYMTKAIDSDIKSEWPIWEFLLGQMYNKIGDGKKAAAVFQRLIKESKFGTAPYTELGESYLVMKRPGAAHKAFIEAVNKESSDESDFGRIVQIYTDRKKNKEALYWAELAIETCDSAENRLQKGWVLNNIGRGADAVAFLEESIEVFPESDRLRDRLAYCYYDIKHDYQRALDEYNKLLEKNADLPYIYEEMGYCLDRLERYDEAISLLTEAISNDPDNHSLYARRAYIYSDMDCQSEAISDFKHAVTDREALSGYWNVAHVFHTLGGIHEEYFNDPETAMMYYEQALELDSGFLYTVISVGDIHSHLGKLSEALDWYNKAISINPSYAGCYVRRAQIYARMGEKLHALEDYAKALKMYRAKGETACNHSKIGECYLGLGKYEKALHHLNIAIEKACGCIDCPPRVCHEAYFCFSVYFSKMRQFDKAIESIETAISIANHVQYNKYKEELLTRIANQ